MPRRGSRVRARSSKSGRAAKRNRRRSPPKTRPRAGSAKRGLFRGILDKKLTDITNAVSELEDGDVKSLKTLFPFMVSRDGNDIKIHAGDNIYKTTITTFEYDIITNQKLIVDVNKAIQNFQTPSRQPLTIKGDPRYEENYKELERYLAITEPKNELLTVPTFEDLEVVY